MKKRKILEQILNETYEYDVWSKDGKYFKPDFIRLVNQNYDIEFMVWNYLNNTPFKNIDVDFIREFKDNYIYVFYQFLTEYTVEQMNELEKQNPILYQQFCKQWEDEAIEFRKNMFKDLNI